MTQGRAPHGARGLKPDENDGERANLSRAPHGARGLKLIFKILEVVAFVSRPTRGAWIETHLQNP